MIKLTILVGSIYPNLSNLHKSVENKRYDHNIFATNNMINNIQFYKMNNEICTT